MKKSVNGKLLLLILLCLAFMPLTGCGGVSQDDMLARAKARALMNKGEEEEDGNNDSQAGDSEDSSEEKQADSPNEKSGNDDTDGASDAEMEETIPEPVDPDYVPEDLSLADREQRIIAQLTQISDVIKQYIEQNRGALPPQAKFLGPRSTLSWRVLLLPAMGHEALYRKFRLSEPWDSDHNIKLLPLMPEIYRSSTVGDFKTTVLVPHGSSSAFQSPKRVKLSHIEDGPANTIFLVNAVDQMAVEWTRPVDWEIRGSLIDDVADTGLGGFYVAFGNGRISKLRNDLKDREIIDLVSIDGGGFISLSDVVAMDAGGDASDLVDMGRADLAADGSSGGSDGSASGSDGPLKGAGYDDAVDALQKGEQRRAFQIYHASLIAQRDNGQVQEAYRWIPALKRPATSVRYGLAVKSNRKTLVENPSPIEIKSNTSIEEISGPGAELIDYFCGDPGQRVMRQIIERIEGGQFGEFVTASLQPEAPGKRRQVRRRVRQTSIRNIEKEGFTPVMLRPGVEVLGMVSRPDAVRAARRREVDVVVLFDVALKGSPTDEVQNTTTIELIDVDRGEKLYESRPMNNRIVERLRRDPTREDPIPAEIRRLTDFIDSRLIPQDMPALQPKHVERRISQILEQRSQQSTSVNPLRAMSEIRFYLAAGLVSRHEAWDSMVETAGHNPALPAGYDQLKFTDLVQLVRAEEE